MLSLGVLDNVKSFDSQYIPRWFTDPALALNSVLPSLIHQYDKTRYYNSADGETRFPFTATRAGNATQYDSLGRLVWAPANMYNRSNLLTDAAWSKNTATVTLASGEASPTGDSVFKLVVNNGTSTIGSDALGGFWQVISGLASNSRVCFSFYAKAAEHTSIKVRENITTGVRVRIDLTNGTVVYESGNFNQMQCYATDAGFGWYRIHCTYILSAVATTSNFEIKGGVDTGDGVSGTYISSPQHEMWGDDSPKRYITTGTSASAEYCPRFDYDPLTLTARGLLVEPTATNLVPTSTALSTVSGGTSAVSPSTHMGQSAIRVTFDTLTGGHFGANGALTVAASTQYTVSTYYKPISGGNDLIQLTVTSGAATTDVYANFNTATVTRTALGAGAANATIQDCGNGVFRLTLTFTSVAVPASGSVVILAKINTGTDTRIPSVTGAGEIFDFFGCQLETGSIATSLIPTFGTATTRANDVFSTTSVGWANLSGGTFYVEAYRPHQYTGGSFTNFGDSTGATNRNQFRWSGGNVGQIITSAGVVQSTSPTSFLVANGNIKAANRYSVGNQMMSANGVLTTAGNIATLPAIQTHFMVGQLGSVSEKFNGWIKEVRYYPDFSASDAQLQTLTT